MGFILIVVFIKKEVELKCFVRANFRPFRYVKSKVKKKDGKSRRFLLMVHQVKMSFKEKLFCLMSEKQYLKITRNVLANQKRAAGVDVMSEGVSVKLPRKKNISRNSSGWNRKSTLCSFTEFVEEMHR